MLKSSSACEGVGGVCIGTTFPSYSTVALDPLVSIPTLPMKSLPSMTSYRVKHYCLFGVKIFFCIFNFYKTSGVQLKGMIESSLLSKNEPLTLDIDGVVAL